MQFDALVSFDFNTGALGKSSVDDKINAGKSVAAMSTLLQYDHAGGRQMDGLTRRRQAERLMFAGQMQQAMRLAGAHAASPERPMPQAPMRPPIVVLPSNPVQAPPDVPPIDHSRPTRVTAIITAILSIFKRS
jgi:lysozyme